MIRRSWLLAAALAAVAAPVEAQSFAITNARIHTVSGPVIERGTVVVTDGRVSAVGAGISAPAGFRVIDAAGKVVTPGLMNGSTSLGIVEIGAEAGTNDVSTTDPRITAAFTVTDALNPSTVLIPVTRSEGITRAVVAPGTGASLIAGQGIVIDLGDRGVPAIVHRQPAAMYAYLGETGARLAGGARGSALTRLREALQDARDFAANRTAFDRNQRRDYALSRMDLEALGAVVAGRLPMVVRASRASDILGALRLADEFGFELILAGADEGWMVAPELARRGVPVVINPMDNLPGYEQLNITLENAARMARAGVEIAFATFDAHNARNIKQIAGNAVSYGMPHDAALRAVTVNPAHIFGIDERYGTLQPGKDADIVIWSGDPFELATTVEHVFIRGDEMPKEHRQRDLLERYRRLDTPLPPAYHNPGS